MLYNKIMKIGSLHLFLYFYKKPLSVFKINLHESQENKVQF